MIVPMKKITMVVLDAERKKALKSLARLGVLHIEPQSATSEELEELKARKELLQNSYSLLPDSGKKASLKEAWDLEETLSVAAKINELALKQEQIFQEKSRLISKYEAIKPWGDFNPQDIAGLKELGIHISLYELNKKQLSQLPQTITPFILNKDKNLYRIACVSLKGECELPFKRFEIPEKSLFEIKNEIHNLELKIGHIHSDLAKLSRYKKSLHQALNIMEKHIEFEEVRCSMGAAGALAYLTGYAPVDKVKLLKQKAALKGWALLIQEPKEDDNVPTLVRNPKWVNIIKPVFDFLGVSPGYREYDISFWFLLFFSIFFAMIIGDAGYGLLFFIFTLFIKWRFNKIPAEPVFLLFVTSLCTILWGAFTGTWFGVESLARTTPFSWFVIPGISSFAPEGMDTTQTIIFICFVIGVVHLSIAHIKNFMRLMPKLKAWSELGWLFVVWGMFFVIQILVLKQSAAAAVIILLPQITYAQAALWLILAGFLLIIIFGEQAGNFFKGLAMGFAKLLLKVLDSVGSFSDIISYVRLFAVGLATVKVAEAFNNMAASVGFGLPWAFFAALILFLGHMLNIIMSAMSLIVHGVRLNVLEFSGHLNIEWSGIPYRPFKE